MSGDFVAAAPIPERLLQKRLAQRGIERQHLVQVAGFAERLAVGQCIAQQGASRLQVEAQQTLRTVESGIGQGRERVEVTGVDQERMTEEFGDLLFALAQYGRRLGIDSEGALRKACTKFETRFRVMEGEAASRISSGEKLSADEWDRLWRFAKETVTQRGGVSS